MAVLAWFTGNVGTSTECARGLTVGEFGVSQVLRYRPRATELLHWKPDPEGEEVPLLEVVPGSTRRKTGFGGTAQCLRITAAGRREAERCGVDPLSRLLKAGNG